MIKVINVTSDSNIGGAGRCVLTFLKKYDRDKFDISVALPTGSALIDGVKEQKVRYFEIEGIAEKSLSISTINTFVRLFRREKPDIVHAHACMSARIAAKLCGIKTIYTRHSVFPNSPRLTKGLGKFICGIANNVTADKVIAVAEAAKENVVETGVDPKSVVIVKNGVLPVEKIDSSQFKRKFDIGDRFVFGIIARVEEIKGHDIYIDAAKNLIKEGYIAAFLICGTGNYLEHIKQRIQKENLSEFVIATGHLDDVKQAINAIDVNVNASFGTEATSLALLEGMSLGKPIIASDYGGNPELVINGYNGLVFRSEQAQELADCMKILYDDRKLYSELSENAKKDFNEKYTADIYAKNIQNVYLSVLGKERKYEKI